MSESTGLNLSTNSSYSRIYPNRTTVVVTTTIIVVGLLAVAAGTLAYLSLQGNLPFNQLAGLNSIGCEGSIALMGGGAAFVIAGVFILNLHRIHHFCASVLYKQRDNLSIDFTKIYPGAETSAVVSNIEEENASARVVIAIKARDSRFSDDFNEALRHLPLLPTEKQPVWYKEGRSFYYPYLLNGSYRLLTKTKDLETTVLESVNNSKRQAIVAIEKYNQANSGCYHLKDSDVDALLSLYPATVKELLGCDPEKLPKWTEGTAVSRARCLKPKERLVCYVKKLKKSESGVYIYYLPDDGSTGQPKFVRIDPKKIDFQNKEIDSLLGYSLVANEVSKARTIKSDSSIRKLYPHPWSNEPVNPAISLPWFSTMPAGTFMVIGPNQEKLEEYIIVYKMTEKDEPQLISVQNTESDPHIQSMKALKPLTREEAWNLFKQNKYADFLSLIFSSQIQAYQELPRIDTPVSQVQLKAQLEGGQYGGYMEKKQAFIMLKENNPHNNYFHNDSAYSIEVGLLYLHPRLAYEIVRKGLNQVAFKIN